MTTQPATTSISGTTDLVKGKAASPRQRSELFRECRRRRNRAHSRRARSARGIHRAPQGRSDRRDRTPLRRAPAERRGTHRSRHRQPLGAIPIGDAVDPRDEQIVPDMAQRLDRELPRAARVAKLRVARDGGRIAGETLQPHFAPDAMRRAKTSDEKAAIVHQLFFKALFRRAGFQRVICERAPERPYGARHAVAIGDHGVEGALDPVAVGVVDHKSRK